MRGGLVLDDAGGRWSDELPGLRPVWRRALSIDAPTRWIATLTFPYLRYD